MRATLDTPDPLLRTLKARAALLEYSLQDLKAKRSHPIQACKP